MNRGDIEALVRRIPSPVLVLEEDGTVLLANPAAASVLGEDAGGSAGTSLASRLAEPDRLAESLGLWARSGSPVPAPAVVTGHDGTRWSARGAVQPLTDEPGRVLVVTLERRAQRVERFLALDRKIQELHAEVRRRVRLEREKARLLELEREARRELEVASRLKDEFLATLSHELRTPLNAIGGWIAVLRETRDEEKRERAVAVIQRNAEALRKLVDDLLDVSRIVSGKLRLELRPLDLAPIVEEALDSLAPTLEAKRLRLDRRLDPHAGSIAGDPERLHQVIWNLLSNAIKFTPRGGRIEVVLWRVDSRVELVVSDTGEGIAPEVLPFVFDRFSQADGSIRREHGGLGLGLAIVRHLVELHGGLVVAESDGVGRGASFTVSLPVRLAGSRPSVFSPEEAGSPAEPPPERIGFPDLEVLVVEDHADSRELVVTLLEGAGARVRAVDGAAAALRAFEERRPGLIVSDIEMPGEDGLTLIRKIRHLERSGAVTPAVALTAHSTSRDRLRALQAGFQAHLAKPVDPEELLLLVSRLADSGGGRPSGP